MNILATAGTATTTAATASHLEALLNPLRTSVEWLAT
jgi:hypothetical protein